ncbi:MAG TPA: NAD(P)/FAD-dependent oxidoreductase, partial [Gemmatimonadales bacterium]
LTLDFGWLPPAVASGIGLDTRGSFASSEIASAVTLGDGQWLTLPRDAARAAQAIRPFSARDADRWPGFTTRLARIAGFLEALYQLPAPDLDTTSVHEILPLLGVAGKLRRLGRDDMIELLRILPMAIQELVDDTFESEPLKAAIAAAGIQDIRQGPRSGGTTFVLLHHLVGADAGSIRGRPAWTKGPNALANAIEDAARGAKVTIRAVTDVARITVVDERVTGIVLGSGEEISAPVVLSTLDPARTLLGLVDPVWLDPEFLQAVKNIKFRGCRATALFALDGLPEQAWGDGVVSLTPDTLTLERAYDAAKYGQVSERPHVEFAVPTLRWPDLAPHGKHVVVAHVQYVPYQQAVNNEQSTAARDDLADTVTRLIDEAVPGFAARVRHRVCNTPNDLEHRFGITEGAVTHGELTLDQILFMRPVPGWGRHEMPIAGLYLGGVGTHPGPGVLGGPGWLAAKRVLAGRKKARAVNGKQ